MALMQLNQSPTHHFSTVIVSAPFKIPFLKAFCSLEHHLVSGAHTPMEHLSKFSSLPAWTP
jgi:hypothetical protein